MSSENESGFLGICFSAFLEGYNSLGGEAGGPDHWPEKKD